MKRLPFFEKFLILIFNPQIVIFNDFLKISVPLYLDDGTDISDGKASEIIITNSIQYNHFYILGDYNSFLYKHLEDYGTI